MAWLGKARAPDMTSWRIGLHDRLNSSASSHAAYLPAKKATWRGHNASGLSLP